MSAPISAQNNRDFLNIARAGVSVSLGLTGDQQGFGLLRALASFSHFLDAGPLGGWQFRAEAQMTRPPDLESVYLVDERVHLSLVAPTVAGWNLRFDTDATAQGGLDPATATQRGVDASADVSRGFMLPGLGQEHRVHLRLTEDHTQTPLFATDQRSTRASLDYTHPIGLGSIGTDLAAIRTQTNGAPSATSTRIEVKFSRPF